MLTYLDLDSILFPDVCTVYDLWCLTPLSAIFKLYRGSVLLVEEAGENH